MTRERLCAAELSYTLRISSRLLGHRTLSQLHGASIYDLALHRARSDDHRAARIERKLIIDLFLTLSWIQADWPFQPRMTI